MEYFEEIMESTVVFRLDKNANSVPVYQIPGAIVEALYPPIPEINEMEGHALNDRNVVRRMMTERDHIKHFNIKFPNMVGSRRMSTKRLEKYLKSLGLSVVFIREA